MSDFLSSLPVRTENNGDVAVKVVDSTVTSQGLTINPDGSVNVTDNGGSLTVDGSVSISGTSNVNVTNAAGASAVNIQDGGNSITVDGTVAATQSGTWAVNNNDGSGNALTSAAAGSTRPLDVALRDGSGNLLGTATSPISVAISADIAGTEVDDYSTATVAAAASSNHSYTVTSGKTLLLKQIEASGSGRMKIEVQIETGAATNSYTTKFVQFNSTSHPNCSIHLESPISVAAGVRVRIIRTNRDLASQDLYSTISGQEV